MKIVDGNLAALTNAVANTGQTPGSAGRAAGPAEAAADRAELSGLAGKLNEAVAGDSPERAARVDALREAVASGRYAVDSGAVARGLAADALGQGSGESDA